MSPFPDRDGAGDEDVERHLLLRFFLLSWHRLPGNLGEYFLVAFHLTPFHSRYLSSGTAWISTNWSSSASRATFPPPARTSSVCSKSVATCTNCRGRCSSRRSTPFPGTWNRRGGSTNSWPWTSATGFWNWITDPTWSWNDDGPTADPWQIERTVDRTVDWFCWPTKCGLVGTTIHS